MIRQSQQGSSEVSREAPWDGGVGVGKGWGAGYQLLWASVPRVFGKGPKEIPESACQKVSLFQNPNDMSGQVRVNYAMLPF